MIRLLLTTLLSILIAGAALAQSKSVTLTGIIVVAGTHDTVPYKVVLSDNNGVVKGYSLTYNEPHETKTKIKGMLDRQAHTLSFKETEIEYVHGYHSGASMCLINAGLQEGQGSNGRILKGPANSNESDNTSCGAAKIYFTNEAEIADLFSYHEKFDTVISMKRKVKDTTIGKKIAVVIPDAPLTTDKVTAGEDKAYEWHSDTVIVDIWDGGSVDGDRITLQFNGKNYLLNYSLVKERKQLRLPLEGHEINTISIIAENEGTEPPNTASLLFTDVTTKYSLLAYNKKGQKALIKIKRVK